MAIKISGSTIIDDSRNIVNAGIITASSFNSSAGAGLTIVDGGVLFSGVVTSTSFSGSLAASNLTGAITATEITLADESSDTTCFPVFATAATGDLEPKTGTNLTFNSSSGALTATSFVGDVTGNVTGNTSGSSGSCTGNSSTATTATNVTVADESSDTSCNVLFTTAATGDLAPKSGTNLTFNSSSGVLTATGFAGDLTGAVTGNADTATTATNVTVADESSDTSCNVLFTTAATGNLAPKSGTNLTFNSSSGVLTATGFAGDLTGAVTGNADTATTATNANHINVADNESTNENNLIPFIEDASATGNVGLESDGDFHYNPSTGTVTCTILVSGAGTLGSNGNGTRTVSTSDPSSGNNGDVWYKYEA